MKKPERTPFLEFYLGPVVALVDAYTDKAIKVYRRLAGRWFCEYCKQYHSRRTVKYWDVRAWEHTCSCSLSREDAGQDHTQQRKKESKA